MSEGEGLAREPRAEGTRNMREKEKNPHLRAAPLHTKSSNQTQNPLLGPAVCLPAAGRAQRKKKEARGLCLSLATSEPSCSWYDLRSSTSPRDTQDLDSSVRDADGVLSCQL